MKVALVAGEDEGWGGIGTYTWVLGRALAELGHDVALVVRGWEGAVVEPVGGLMVHRVPVAEPEWHRLTGPLLSRMYSTREAAVFSLGAARVLRELRPDIAEFPEFGGPGLMAATRGRIRAIVRLHTPTYLARQLAAEAMTLDDRLHELLELIAAHRAGTVSSPSAALADAVAHRWRLNRSRLQVVPNPVDEDVFRPTDQSPVAGRIVIVGRVERAKGHDLLVEALPAIRAAVPDAHIVAAGADGGLLESLRRRAGELGVEDRITFLGALPRDELPALYRSAVACTVPSRFESFSYTAAEAMATGRAVVATRVGALPEVVADGIAGVIVEPEQPAALAAGLIEVLSDPARRATLERGARWEVETRFASRTVAQAMVKLYTAVS